MSVRSSQGHQSWLSLAAYETRRAHCTRANNRLADIMMRSQAEEDSQAVQDSRHGA
jgi:hypothetical protein